MIVNEIPATNKGLINLKGLPLNQEIDFLINTELSWANDIKNEVILYNTNESGVDTSSDSKDQNQLEISGTIIRKNSREYGDHLLFYGHIKGCFNTHCVKCLVEMEDSFYSPFNVCFLNKNLEQDEMFLDADSFFCYGEEREIQYYSAGPINLRDCLRELVFLELTLLPTHDPECKGLCPECGTNLNTDTCVHQNNA